MEFFFLPPWPLRPEDLPWFPVLLLAAVLAGELVQSWLRLPRMLGWIACGVGAGAGLVDPASLDRVRWLLDIAVGMVLFELGQRVNYGWLRRNPWLFASSVLEGALGFAAVFGILLLLEVKPLFAATAAAIFIATSPAVVLTLSKELRAQGQVTERVLMLCALNCIYALVTASVLLAWMHAEYHGDWFLVVAHPLYLVAGSLCLAATLAVVTLFLLGQLVRRADAQFICVVSMVIVAVACAEALRLSVTLALLAFGAMARGWDDQRRFVALEFGPLGRIAVVFLFALTAARIDPRILSGGVLAGGAVLVAARWAGKAIGVLALARLAGLPIRKASLVALGLVPTSGFTLVIMRDTFRMFPQVEASLLSTLMTAVVMLELFGPLTAHFALTRAGEADTGR